MPSVEFPDKVVADLIASGAYGFFALQSAVDPVETIEDIVDRDTLQPQTNWVYGGVSREGQGSNYEQSVTTTELRVDQDTDVVFENIAEVGRQIQLQWAQFDPAKLAILEESDVEGGTGVGGAVQAGDLFAIHGGSITSRKRYRVALLGRREPGQGRDITNSDGDTRGELFGVVLQNASISAGSNQWELQRGQLANMSPVFKGYADPETGDAVAWVGEYGPETLGS